MKTGLDRVDSFGGTDADGDALLKDCFEDHPAYRAVRSHRKNLVRGRKGAGKTAIFKRLVRESGNDVSASGYSFEDYPWYHHSLQEEVGVPAERRYVHSWKYLILLGLTQTILEAARKSFWSENESVMSALAALEDFMIDSYGSIRPGLNQLFNPQYTLRWKGGVNLGFANFGADRVSMESLPIHIQAVNAQIQQNLFAAMNPNVEYFVCFDQLDHGFSTSDPHYHDRIAGLLIAARELFHAAKDAQIRCNPVVFLRDDIFESLSFEDRNRIRGDSYLLQWEPDSGVVNLKTLMESRFGEVLGTESKPEVSWEEIFDEGERMTRRQTKLAHITDRTYLRPRDMIQFCNEILDSHKQGEPVSTMITNADITEARTNYSRYLLDELDDEVKKHIPEYKDYLKVIQAVGAESFTAEEFRTALEERIPGASPEVVLEGLFRFSVIGYLRPGGAGGGSHWIWQYKDPREKFDSRSTELKTHRGLKEALGLVG
ncbi:P-loop ATPase, Sll1717 family [Curtobacterium sp. MR_MD2014]|uniref:P-loop ATPase, Sll1717 family n=1 Tax=Curtobacterium sp. MR_MD2014 TaxID=1561023 RepID=UPI000B26CD1A|nr:hypothetical protein [Curtobacterium sp. MR_MD2014]